jgi:NAD(P)H-nitrite reductase large subunit
MTTGAAQTLLRSYRVLAGHHIVVAGNGPLNLQVAVELIEAGARVEAVAELAEAPGWRDLSALLRMATSMPKLLSQGRRYQKALERAGVPLLHATRLTAVERSGNALAAVLGDRSGEVRRIEADAVLIGYGLLPSSELLRMLRATHHYDERRRQLVPEVTPQGETSIADLYAAGDCTGLAGAHAAAASGVIVAAGIVRSLGRPLPIGHRDELAIAHRRQADALRFQRGLWHVFRPAIAPEVPLVEAMPICRCESISGAALAIAISDASTAGTLKRATRSGMGRCQGRYCGEGVAGLVADQLGAPSDETHRFAPRPALRPTAIGEIAGLLDTV